MTGIVLSADPSIIKWKTLSAKLAFFDRIYNSGKAGKVWEPWTLETVKVTPKVVNGRIDHKWLEELQKPYFDQGYDFVKFHGSMAQAKAWGIEMSLRGANPIDKTDYEVMYFFADEKSKRNGLNRFEQTAAHEGGHGYYQETGLTDEVHAWHKADADISGLFITFDWNLYQPLRMLLKKLKKLLGLKLEALRANLAIKPETGTIDRLQPLVERKVANVILEMKRLGHEVRVVEGFRSLERQNELYQQGRTTPGAVVTNAKAGESLHNYGVAVDLVFRRQGYDASSALWNLLGKVGKQQGFEWGGDAHWIKAGFEDRPHFQMKLGYSLMDFQNGKVDYNKYK